MKPSTQVLLFALLGLLVAHVASSAPAVPPAGQGATAQMPLGQPGLVGRYEIRSGTNNTSTNSVTAFVFELGPVENLRQTLYQWLRLEAVKSNGQRFRVWVLTSCYPPSNLGDAQHAIARYLLQESDPAPIEFQDEFTGKAVLPSIGGWQHLWPRTLLGQPLVLSTNSCPPETRYLGRRFLLKSIEASTSHVPPVDVKVVKLLPDLLVGVASNTRQKDERRRYDNSDYELVKLTRADYAEMVAAGLNCLKVDAEQLPWVQGLNAFYWGISPRDLSFPECLYRSTYLGSTLFLDEPAVGTRDYVIRPRLAKEPEFRKSITPQLALQAFQDHFQQALKAAVMPDLFPEPDSAASGEAPSFRQENLFSWETMISTAAYQLSCDPLVPAAMVFEPPGRVGTFRTLPEMDMTYGCQIPVDDPKNFTDIIYGFLRGAARLTSKRWGTSIYGAVDRADAFWYLTRAYDVGASRFFFWDNAKIACVPYHECLALARNLRAHAENYPLRNLAQLNHAAEVAVLLPPGYNLGHVHLGKGTLWGLPELNLERVNQYGVKYRTVMGNFFAEIERCLRAGVAFDLLWDLPALHLTGYREVVRVREDGRVEITNGSRSRLLKGPRTPPRPAGAPPGLSVEISKGKSPLRIQASARIIETSAPVYYTYGADNHGIYHNAMVAWELFGPGVEDYRALQPEGLQPSVVTTGSNSLVTVSFRLPRPGHYRLRAATVDLAGRSTVRWTNIDVRE